MTFLDLINKLKKYVRTSTAEHDEVIKSSINEAHLWAQRAHNFMLAEDTVDMAYTLDERSVEMPATPDIKELIAVEDENGEFYEKLSKEQFLEWRLRTGGQVNRDNTFYASARKLSLFPIPEATLNLILHVNTFLPALEDDEDTDFLVKYCWDFLQYKALATLSVFLHEDVRVQGINQLVEMKWLSVLEWDYRLRGDFHQAQELAQKVAQLPRGEGARQ